MQIRRAVIFFFSPVDFKPTDPQWAYRPDIDGLRALAALIVLFHHAEWLVAAGSGVDIFFVVSGFLISGIIFRTLQSDHFSLIEFYARRIKRIFPALLALLLTVWAAGWWLLPPQQYARLGGDIAASAGFSENIWFYLSIRQRTQTSDYLITHLWTLGVQEQFYLFWPLFLWATWKIKRGHFAFILALAIALSFGLCISLAPTDITVLLLPWHRLWELGLGGALAYLQLVRTPAQEKVLVIGTVHSSSMQSLDKRLASWIGAGCLIVSTFGLLPDTAAILHHVLLTSMGTALLIYSDPRCWFNRYVLSSRPLVQVGLMSYPLYLWHLPLFMFMRIIFETRSGLLASLLIPTAIASLMLSHITYRHLELPIQRLKGTKRVAGILAVAMAVCGTVSFLCSR